MQVSVHEADNKGTRYRLLPGRLMVKTTDFESVNGGSTPPLGAIMAYVIFSYRVSAAILAST